MPRLVQECGDCVREILVVDRDKHCIDHGVALAVVRDAHFFARIRACRSSPPSTSFLVAMAGPSVVPTSEAIIARATSVEERVPCRAAGSPSSGEAPAAPRERDAHQRRDVLPRNRLLPKHDKIRSVPLSHRLAEALNALPRRGLWVVSRLDGDLLSQPGLYDAMIGLYERAGVVAPPEATNTTSRIAIARRFMESYSARSLA